LLGKIDGADAVGLTQLLAKHASNSTYRPLSQTDQKPAEAPSHLPSTPQKAETGSSEELDNRLQTLMNQSKAVLFMKGSPDAPRCGFSKKIVGILHDQNVEFTHYNILEDDNVRQGIQRIFYKNILWLIAFASRSQKAQ